MVQLVSPGVAVTVIDESQYGSGGQGTVPLIVLATKSNKPNVSGTGYAEGTQPANAKEPYLLTSQRELIEKFGQPHFEVEDGTPIHGHESNEYGLLAAYSYLGLANRAYVLRADIDLEQIKPRVNEPTGDPADGTYWLDLTNTVWGVFEASATGTGNWVKKSYTIIDDLADTIGGSGLVPLNAIGSDGDYALVATSAVSSYQVYKRVSGAWVIATSAGLGKTVFCSPHYSIPTATAVGDVWFKTTNPNSGLKLVVKKFNSALKPQKSPWVTQTVNAYVGANAAAADAAATTALTLAGATAPALGSIYGQVISGAAGAKLRIYTSTGWDDLGEEASLTEVTGAPLANTLWYNPSLSADIYQKSAGKWVPVTGTVTIDATAPSGASTNDIWVSTADEENYPAIYQYDGSTWVQRDTKDQTTPNGVVFADLTATAADTSNAGGATLVANAPDPVLYPDGIFAWNAIVSTGNVKRYNATTGIWDTYSGNQEDGRPYMLRKAQRRSVVRAMQEVVNENTKIREELTYFTLIAAPGYPELLDEMLQLNVDRKETAFIIVDTPFRLKPDAQKLLDWISGNYTVVNGEDGITTATNQAACYYPSGITSDLDGNDVVVPASHIVLRTYAYNDQVAYPWFAPAGLTRGLVTNAANVGYLNSEGEFVPVALTNGQRDVLYGDGSRIGINPITRFPGQGLFVFGQRTMQSFSSALDRVNVARLIAYLRERFDPLARPFIFEPNDRITRANAKQVFDGFLGDLISKRAIYDFIVVCDESNNTPARIDRNELWIDVAIEPVKAAEFIYIPIRVVNTGELSAG